MAGKRHKMRGKGSRTAGHAATASRSSTARAPTPASRIDAIKARILPLRARDVEITEQKATESKDSRVKLYGRREHGEVRAALAEAEAELEVEVRAPVANGVDPTEWLPEELLMEILIRVVTAGVCGLVCRRWYIACQVGSVKRRAWDGRWEGYIAGWRAPQKLVGHTDCVITLALGPNETVYSGGEDKTVRVWSAIDGTHLRTLEGHTAMVVALAVGGDGTVYSGSMNPEGSIRVWSSTDGTSLGTLEGHPDACVWVLAIAADGTLFSGSSDSTIRVWFDGEHVRTLRGHTHYVTALAVGTHGKLYSGSLDKTVRVWSVADETPVSTLEGHTDSVRALAVGVDGTVHSGSTDGTIRVWSGEDNRLLRTLQDNTSAVLSLKVGTDGTIFSGSETVRVWCGATGALRFVLPATGSRIRALAVGKRNKLYAGLEDESQVVVW